MKIIGLDDKYYNFPPLGYESEKFKHTQKSALHLNCRELLYAIYPCRIFLEEVPIPGSQLKLDFYIPHISLAIEVHGEQHFKFTPYFYSSKLEFYKAQQRDRTKAEWCNLNNIELVRLMYNESVEQWKQKILGT